MSIIIHFRFFIHDIKYNFTPLLINSKKYKMKYTPKSLHGEIILTFTHFNNYFNSSTKNNFIKMVRINTYMDANLSEAELTNTEINDLYIIFHPQHLTFMALYLANVGAVGVQQGKVFTKDELLAIMEHTYLGDWDFEIQKVCRKGTEL